MNEELEKKLFKKYPKLFIQKDLDMQVTCMCWGIECGDGWYDLIDKTCHLLQFNIDKNKHSQIEFVQVKEKFGGLRLYYNVADDYLRGIIDFAEHMSYYICENCGTNQNVSQNKTGWISTLCKNCREKRSK